MTLTELKEKYNSYSNGIKALIIMVSFIAVYTIVSIITDVSTAGALLIIAVVLGGIWFMIKIILDMRG